MNDRERYREAQKASIISLIVNIVLTGLKIMVGLAAGSAALVADGFHSASDLIGTLVVMQGIKIAHQPADESHPYGHYRAETITSKILAIILILTAMGLGYEGLQVLRSPELSPPEMLALYIALFSVIAKEGIYQYNIRIGKRIKSSAIIADAWHARSDAFSSIAASIGIVGSILGYPIMDPLAAIFVAFLILKTGVSIYVDSIKTLMDTAPPKEILDMIETAALAAEGVEDVHDIKVRQYGSKYLIDIKICVNPYITVEEGHGAAARAKLSIMNEVDDVQDVLIHVNPCYSRHKRD
ncbi:cation diffusion facilitator family transporter [Alkaliphilus metalliredigens QYMF]|uniref:Cation diffusion facilitator family transporter n=1 Tax=Alkaliphilus metalliredigens (strain QYMF) TaxID=293826 RepID=A6TSV8_ALKMQ|nr:cation diffusion facilitator family transporter [Alkaliphilus metalliredigens]ABR49276.1 cation diffusion facilitator family transporter [Alkaliphilus metalliredigens QYMF]